MKRTGIFIIIISLILICCKLNYYTHQVRYLNGESQTLSLRSTGFGSTQLKAVEDAEIATMKTLFFRGIPASQQKDALISQNESDALKQNHAYFDDFFDKGRYKTFIISSVPVTNLTKYKGTVQQITVDVKINLYALRKDLEQNNIIRTFGY